MVLELEATGLTPCDTLFILLLTKSFTRLIGPAWHLTCSLISPLLLCFSPHLCSKDVAGALEATIECQKLYNQLPRIHDIIVALVEKGDTEVLQKGSTLISEFFMTLRSTLTKTVFLWHFFSRWTYVKTINPKYSFLTVSLVCES